MCGVFAWAARRVREAVRRWRGGAYAPVPRACTDRLLEDVDETDEA